MEEAWAVTQRHRKGGKERKRERCEEEERKVHDEAESCAAERSIILNI